MTRIAHYAAVGVLTLGLAVGGAALTTGTASAAPTYCSPSVGCNDKPGTKNDRNVKKGPSVPDGYSKALAQCAGNTALAAAPGPGWVIRGALGAWGGWTSCDDFTGYLH
ncbi:hypothetical protein HQ325_12660 [Rhodococcus sp. BP-349]|uniref:hypothetical protein n=1 Tax=unclassified Rhodococcus (in: high G+C Gram-positive bacteria) TaxID=192944 RepID=UPI001C9AE761|nr:MULTISPECIES: hypothetical protein [unclassified Rhodococcus (in: high G+C Gram-positive bacteria)]MBY6539526.1 hypothetical protein [Rhodococcus sp. BP-363]MBY6544146.1 hypothetical protein [Rhodococcus sp. BP-369]MBY6563376.1 hypothetical protein [Rhodococcus sp. BP-370]MBY6577668.1 hypothetical protein [Rhodococcus sp. BP-364]MBY6586969.1 hypothetical protein [Rhodococcus sp. BP-358]